MISSGLRALAAALLAAFVLACTPSASGDDPITLETDDERLIYAMGVAMARSNPGLAVLEPSPREAAALRQGLLDVAHNRELQIDVGGLDKQFGPFLKTRAEAVAVRERGASEPFLSAAEAEEGAVRLPSGTVLKILQSGEATSSEIPLTALVKLRIEGRDRDGKVFAETGEDPSVVRMSKLLPCWREGIQQASIGTVFKVTCPPDTAYGDQGMLPAVKPGSAVAFQLEVVDVIHREALPGAPGEPKADS